jgi:hypothetical protein
MVVFEIVDAESYMYLNPAKAANSSCGESREFQRKKTAAAKKS